jgi:ABC-type transport system involved in cytochrome bd biosynthesis fused ATPase/permease subunit
MKNVSSLKEFAARNWAKLCHKLGNFCDRYTYTIPIILAGFAIFASFYLFYATAAAVSDMNEVIKSIPRVVQVEMEKTRKVLEKESQSNRDVIRGQHEVTREDLEITRSEIQDRMKVADRERRENKKMLDDINKKLNDTPAPKRQKVLGVF